MAQFFGGTSILIAVGVLLDTMRQVESHLMMRHYDGFLKKGPAPRTVLKFCGRNKIKVRGRFEIDASGVRGGGKVLEEIGAFIKPGVTTQQVDDFAAEQIKSHGAKSAFLGYRKYPCHTCLSVNEEVVHGLANERELRFGDIVSVDVGVTLQRFYRRQRADVRGRRLRSFGAAAVGRDGAVLCIWELRRRNRGIA